jgi:RNA polymerase sigma-70 factor, ECF subfamily
MSHDAGVTPLPFVGDEAALARALRAGHPGAAAAFYDAHARHVLRTLRSMLGADEDVPDLLQEVFMRGFNGIGKLRDIGRTRSWLTKIAIFVATHRLRVRIRRNRLRVLSPEHTRPTQCEQPSLDARRSLHEVYQVLDEMPVDERTAFTLRYIDGTTLPVAADACRISLATLKRMLARAEQRFLEAVRARPGMEDWLEVGTRWSERKPASRIPG